MEILNGKDYRLSLQEEYKEIISKEKLDIRLDIILVGNNKASLTYINNKIKYCEKVSIKVNLHTLDENTKEEELIRLIEELNNNPLVNGIILQSPTPSHIDFKKCAGLINPLKDIDGFTKDNVYNIYQNNKSLSPCTAKGIIKLIKHYNINLESKHVVIIGRSEIVGKPLALMMLNENATVTICHSKTINLSEITKTADILISAVGKSRLIKNDMVKDGFIGIDVGINFEDGKLVGDFDFDNIKDKASYITPVPGGVGPMTIAMIIENLIIAKKLQK